MVDVGKFVTIKESFTLPSKGQIYGLEGNPEVELRSMTNAEDLELSGYSENEYKKLSDVIESCIVKPLPIKVYDMCIGDYTFLLHKLRILTYGPDYPITIQCPNCKEIVKADTSLDSLEVLEFNSEEVEKCRNITLPVSKLKVKLGFQTPRMLDEIKSKAKDFKIKKKTQGVNYDTLFEIISFISKIDNEVIDEVQLEDIVMKLPAKDAKYILQKGRELNGKVGLDTSVIAKCSECGYEVLTRFQYNSEFFNPTFSED